MYTTTKPWCGYENNNAGHMVHVLNIHAYSGVAKVGALGHMPYQLSLVAHQDVFSESLKIAIMPYYLSKELATS